MAENMNLREIVYDMLLSVVKQQTPSHILLSQVLTKYQYIDKKDRAFISRTFRGTLEYEIYLDYVISRFSSVKINKIKKPVLVLLRMGAYQILKMDHVPDSAACDETVKLAKRRGLKNLSGFINGVLRNIARNKDGITYPDREKEPALYLSVRYCLPEWLVRMWLKTYGFEQVAKMGEAMLHTQKTSVRVRPQGGKIDACGMKAQLDALGIETEDGHICPDALRISGYDYLGDVAPFIEGAITVQDESAMLSALAAGVKSGDQIIDCCAAPGGKSLHLADLLLGSGHVSARDLTEEKVARIEENLYRTGVENISFEVQDALKLCEEDIESCDIVMADLPCSGLGVIGKKPDIKRSMTPEKLGELAKLQRDILSVVQRYVKPDGVLIYSTCTVNEEENTGNMKWFLEHFPFKLESLDPYMPEHIRNADTAKGFIQILPGQYESDGFFIARFRRIGSGN